MSTRFENLLTNYLHDFSSGSDIGMIELIINNHEDNTKER